MRTTALRPIVAVVTVGLLLVPIATGVAAKPDQSLERGQHAVIDRLGEARPGTAFSVFGSSGGPVSATLSRGPMFVLGRPTVITEFGAFLNNCASLAGGVAQCPDTQPFVVELRPSLDGRPDPARVIATLELSHDNDPYAVSYESVRVKMLLPAGTYFALIRPSAPSDEGFILGTASDPFSYEAGMGTDGVLESPSSESSSTEIAPQAVRILAVGRGG